MRPLVTDTIYGIAIGLAFAGLALGALTLFIIAVLFHDMRQPAQPRRPPVSIPSSYEADAARKHFNDRDF